ncbi:hypothetical protein B566_EDAN016732 [Ephemera danica]|nr:hypothetical protein B566_EDAN016732 [Ephemera danica]
MSACATKRPREANTTVRPSDRVQVLDADEFVAFFHALVYRGELHEIFERYTKGRDQMTAEELANFLRTEEQMVLSTAACEELILQFEQSDCHDEKKLSETLKAELLFSVDCWDGSDDEPIVYHGRTLTSKILFKDILNDAIKPYAFMRSPYPVILSLENHCSTEQQKKLAFYLKDLLGDATDLTELPSPEQLKYKIIVKAKKLAVSVPDGELPAGQDAEESDESEADDEQEDDETDGQKVSKVKVEVDHNLSDLVNICQAVHFHGFESAQQKMSLNYQSSDKHMATNEAKFLATEGEIIDPYVQVEVIGHEQDRLKFKTTAERNNGLNPFWNESVECQLNWPEFDLLKFTVRDENMTGKDQILGTYCVPITSLQPGYRHIFLKAFAGTVLAPASLFVRIVFNE